MGELLTITVFLILFGGLKLFRYMGYLPPVHAYTKGRFYWAYGLALLTLFTFAEWFGWGLLDSDKVKDVPKNVRDNPGVYRSHYRSYGRTYGGK